MTDLERIEASYSSGSQTAAVPAPVESPTTHSCICGQESRDFWHMHDKPTFAYSPDTRLSPNDFPCPRCSVPAKETCINDGTLHGREWHVSRRERADEANLVREICQCGKPLMPREHVMEEDDWNCRNRVPAAPPADKTSPVERCTACKQTFDAHPEPGLCCYPDATFSSRWSPPYVAAPPADKPTDASPLTKKQQESLKPFIETRQADIALRYGSFHDTKIALKSQIDICNDLRQRLEQAERKLVTQSTFAYELAMFLTRNNQHHTFTAPEMQKGIEEFLRDKR